MSVLPRRKVDSLVARCITQPSFIDFLEAGGVSGLPAELQQSVNELDLSRVRLFSGMVVKVAHTYLWNYLPRTLLALKKADLEFPAFVDYAPIYRARQGSWKKSPDRTKQTESIIRHFDHFLLSLHQGKSIRFCREILKLEELLLMVDGRLVGKSPLGNKLLVGPDSSRYATVGATALLKHEFGLSHGSITVSALRSLDTSEQLLEEGYFCLGHDQAASMVHIWELTPFSALLLRLATQKTNDQEIAASAGFLLGLELSTKQIRPGIDALIQEGIIVDRSVGAL